MSRVAAMQSAVDDLARKHSHRRLYSAGNADEDVTLESKYAPLQSIAKRPGLAADAAAQQAVRTFTTASHLYITPNVLLQFHEKTWVWVKDPTQGYVSSWVDRVYVDKEGNEVSVCRGVDDKVRSYMSSQSLSYAE